MPNKKFFDMEILEKMLEPARLEMDFFDEVSECENCRRRTREGRDWNFCRKHKKHVVADNENEAIEKAFTYFQEDLQNNLDVEEISEEKTK